MIRILRIYKHIYLCFILLGFQGGFVFAFDSIVTTPKLNLTEQEQSWIHEHPIVYYSDDNYLPPFVLLNAEGELEGISKEYLDKIQTITQIQFKFIQKDNWSDVIQSLQKHEIQLVLAAIYSEEREKYALFSKPYFSSPMAIVTNQNYSYIQNLKELNGKTIAVPKGFYTNSYLSTHYPKIKIYPVKDVLDALKAINQGKAEAFVGNIAIAIYNLKNTIHSNLKISGTFDASFDIRFMGSSIEPELISIINKALKLIPASEQRNIENSWFGVEFDQGINPATVWKIVLSFIALFLLTLIWIKRLKSEVTLRKETESRLRSLNVRAEQANIAKTNFIANMSHEIRTPMNAISGFTQLLELTKLNPEQKNYINSIHIGTDALLHVINDVLDISEMEHGTIKLHPERVNIQTLVEETLSMFLSEFETKSISLKSSFSGEINQLVEIDKNRLRQIIINLVANALKFTSQGCVCVNSSITTSTETNRLTLTIEVVDTGIGIEAQRVDEIFEKFVHHENMESEYYRGTGLGLTISQNLAQLLGGEISVSSKLGEGSTFTLKIELNRLN